MVGWAMANHMRTQLVLDALDMALYRRRPGSVIHHSDQGSQYTALAFGKRCRQAGVRPSMGSVGDCYDKCPVRKFFRYTRKGAAGSSSVCYPWRGSGSGFRVPGRLVQSPSAALGLGTTISRQLREVSFIKGVKPKRKTVREIGVPHIRHPFNVLYPKANIQQRS